MRVTMWARTAMAMAALLVITASCGAGSRSTTGDDGRERTVAVDTTTDYVADYATLDRAGVIYAAPLVVRGTVESVDGPFWNSKDGQKWEPIVEADDETPADSTVPVLYREVTVRIADILRNDHGFDGTEIAFLAIGGGEGSDDRDAVVGGRFTAGDEVILFLSLDVFYMRSGPIAAYQPFYLGAGVFHVGDDGKVLSEGDITLLEMIQDPEIDPMDKPSPPEFPSLASFLADITGARDTAQPAWEPYRPAEDSAYSQIEMIEQAIEDGRPRG